MPFDTGIICHSELPPDPARPSPRRHLRVANSQIEHPFTSTLVWDRIIRADEVQGFRAAERLLDV
jgi:hypothetical protein